MNRSIQFNNYPFKFLLYLEWVLLTLAIVSTISPLKLRLFFNQFPELTICSLIIFGVMGLRLPTHRYKHKIIYTIVQIILILFTNFLGIKTARLFPFLYLILVTRSCLIFQMQGRLVVAILSFFLFVSTLLWRVSQISLTPTINLTTPIIKENLGFFVFSFALLFGLTLLFFLLMMNTLIAERQSREQLAFANQKLREYALKIENQATLEERNRIAREIHDSLGHSLTALNLQLETAVKLWQSQPKKAQSFLQNAKQLGSQALQDVRHSVSTMGSLPLQHQSLAAAVTDLADNVYQTTGIKPNLNIALSVTLSQEIATAIYRIIQESLTNICKYAKATQIDLIITSKKNHLLLQIEDNGIGFNVGQNTTGFGIKSMRDRTLALGGNFKINSHPNCGCQIIVNIPLIE
ncbi:MAG: sensor histidine kinase [Calothrix sp. MO_167.B12]|nr:sensor histidine kinase [Calothrix sp. MO_167.B12]